MSLSGCAWMRRESKGSPLVLVVMVVAVAGGGLVFAPADAKETSSRIHEILRVLQGVSSGARATPAAARAWKELSAAGPDALPAILAGMDGANPIAANWIRSAADAVAERGLQKDGKLPATELERFVKDTSHAPRARRTAYEWLLRVDATAADRLIPGMLHDPGVEFRRDAVARLIEQASEAEKGDKGKRAIARYREALGGARDPDQVKKIAKSLRALGEEVDLPTHFGFLMAWKIVGPFDNAERKGFDRVLPPEKGIDFAAIYKGTEGSATWSDYRCSDEFGKVDLNKALVKKKSVLGYAYTEFTSAVEREVEFRLSTVNAWKLWLNGEPLFGHHEYHHGTEIDHYRVRSKMRRGKNTVLVKVCQNEQTESYAVPWSFQIRVCDASGTAILSTTRDSELGLGELGDGEKGGDKR